MAETHTPSEKIIQQANGSAVEATNPAGESSCTVQDGAGRTVMEINAEGHAAFMLYDVTEPLAILRGTANEAPSFDEIASVNQGNGQFL